MAKEAVSPSSEASVQRQEFPEEEEEEEEAVMRQGFEEEEEMIQAQGMEEEEEEMYG